MKKFKIRTSTLFAFTLVFSLLTAVYFPLIAHRTGLVKGAEISERVLLSEREISFLKNDGSIVYLPFESLVKGAVTLYCNEETAPECAKAIAVAVRGQLLYIYYSGLCRASGADLSEKWVKYTPFVSDIAEKAVDATRGKILKYENDIAYTLFHHSSKGKTLSSVHYGYSIPYLTSVNTDEICEEKTVYITADEFKKLMKKNFGLDVFTNADDMISGVWKNEGDARIYYVNVALKKIKGRDFARALSLDSDIFTYRYIKEENKIAFTVYGKGNGLGMSIMGAQTLANKGADYEDILLHYYKGCSLYSLDFRGTADSLYNNSLKAEN